MSDPERLENAGGLKVVTKAREKPARIRQLTPKQLQILDVLWAGHSVTDAARICDCSRKTVSVLWNRHPGFDREWERRLEKERQDELEEQERQKAEQGARDLIRRAATGTEKPT